MQIIMAKCEVVMTTISKVLWATGVAMYSYIVTVSIDNCLCLLIQPQELYN